jgi:hypothetical protein
MGWCADSGDDFDISRFAAPFDEIAQESLLYGHVVKALVAGVHGHG